MTNNEHVLPAIEAQPQNPLIFMPVGVFLAKHCDTIIGSR
jgi:hypothetical protein